MAERYRASSRFCVTAKDPTGGCAGTICETLYEYGSNEKETMDKLNVRQKKECPWWYAFVAVYRFSKPTLEKFDRDKSDWTRRSYMKLFK